MPSPLFLIFFGILGTSYGSSIGSQCTNFSFPNFLEIGACLQSSGDLCSANTEGIVGFTVDLVQCAFSGLATVDVGSQRYLLIEFLKFLLRAETDDFVVVYPLIIAVCKGLSGVVGTITGNILDINCGKLNFDRKVVCGKPIFISVEATTPFAKCLGKNGLTCDGNTPVYEPVALGSVKVLACLVVYVLTTNPNEAGAQLGCDLLAIVSRTFGSAGSALLSPLLCALQNALRLTCSSLTC
ncbi:hypothetical protein V5799_028954 [Amblyomma americanum]|uniref:Secreted protein n=1 Tax=Amblyomma americanum TaxID=6943 RepID=A0AAQ4DBD9_AMBAM